MKKKLTITMLYMLCMMMLLPLKADAAASYKKLYKKFLSQSSVKAGDETISPKWYYVLNVDKKGVPELIVADVQGVVATYYIYTVSKDKVKYLGSYDTKGVNANEPFFSYSSKYKGLISEWWTNGIGGSGSAMYQIKNKKMKESYYIYSYYDASKGYVYKIGTSGKRVSEKKATAYYNKYFKSYKTYKLKKNNKSNLKKSFD